MAWTAQLIDLGKRQNNEGAQVFTILYTDGTQKLVRDYALVRFDLATLKQTARDEIQRILAKPPIVDLKDLNVGMDIDLTVPVQPPPPPPTPEEQAVVTFLANWRLYQAQQRVVSAGLLAADDKTVTDTFTALQKDFLMSYVGSM